MDLDQQRLTFIDHHFRKWNQILYNYLRQRGIQHSVCDDIIQNYYLEVLRARKNMPFNPDERDKWMGGFRKYSIIQHYNQGRENDRRA